MVFKQGNWVIKNEGRLHTKAELGLNEYCKYSKMMCLKLPKTRISYITISLEQVAFSDIGKNDAMVEEITCII